ncbi:MAG: hypothetical protein ACI8XZ_005377 [Gammaproteobacteria bacterium]
MRKLFHWFELIRGHAAHYPALVTFSMPITLFAAYQLFLIDVDYITILGFSTFAFSAFTLAIGRNYSPGAGAATTLAVENT